MKKQKLLKIMFFVLIGMALATGLTYAYIYFGFAGKETNLIKAGCLKIEFSEKSNINLSDSIALSDNQGKELKPYEFTITNSCTTDAYYETIFNKLTTSSDVDATTKLYLTGDGYLQPSILNSLEEITLTDKPSDVATSYLVDTGYLKVGESKTFYLRMWVDYDATSYGKLDGRIIVNTIAKKGPTFTSNTMGYQIYKSEVIRNSANLENIAPTNEELSGLYQVENANNEYEYYYRGNVINNYVKFGKYANNTSVTYTDSNGISQTLAHIAGEDIIWRIIKINSDGSLKLILDDVIGNSSFNNATNDSKYTGYVYDTTTSSAIKTVVDNFYNTNLLTNYGNYIKDEVYCSDNTSITTNGIIYYGGYTRNISSHSASSNCQSGTVNSKIGLITIDELSYAGALNNTVNSNYYLQKDINGFWTMSPAKYDSSAAYNFASTNKKSVYISSVTAEYAIRPVITLKNNYKLSGNGTSMSPYTIGEEIINNATNNS